TSLPLRIQTAPKVTGRDNKLKGRKVNRAEKEDLVKRKLKEADDFDVSNLDHTRFAHEGVVKRIQPNEFNKEYYAQTG
ncbi:hypothetical protein PENTCL1PPCAC_25945, partial [Pristionchus entomophagus]